jgi:hypothetical protein
MPALPKHPEDHEQVDHSPSTTAFTKKCMDQKRTRTLPAPLVDVSLEEMVPIAVDGY